MKYYLAKTDPETYSIEDLKRDTKTVWDGVRNPQAVQAIKAMKKGDRVLMYHSQGEGAIRGLAEVVGGGRPDPRDAKSWVADFKFIRAFAEPYVTLAEIKESGQFKDFALVKQARLSTMEAPAPFIAWLKRKGLSL